MTHFFKINLMHLCGIKVLISYNFYNLTDPKILNVGVQLAITPLSIRFMSADNFTE